MVQPEHSSPSFGLVSGRPLFLDLMTDSYFLLEPKEEADLLAGIAAGGEQDDLTPVQRSRPSRGAADRSADRPRSSPGDVFKIWRALRSVRRGLRARPLVTVIDSILERGAPGGGQAAICAERLALQFAAARRWLPHASNCLLDSLALLMFLKDHGAFADLVFGAKLDPFAAHCWLEAGDVLLNDRLERIEGFTPVGVVSP